LFFMTTGLVFYPRILRGFAAASWPAIFITRVFRIAPLIAVSVLAITVTIMLRTGALPDLHYLSDAAQWITTWGEPPLLGYPRSGQMNAYVLWSLSYEWLFYLLVLPACALAMDVVRDRLPTWTVPLGLLLAALGVRALHLPVPALLYLPLFPVGMLAHEIRAREGPRRWLAQPWMAIPAVLLLAIAAISAPAPFGVVPLVLFGFFFVCVACGNDLGGVLRTRGALVLGECSYGIYLLHGLVLDLLFVDGTALTNRVGTGALPLLLPLVAVLLALLTAVTFLTVERPAIGLGRNIARFWTNRRLARNAPELQIAP
ncbi:MAG: hypothetical protein EOO78_37430, partial [Oxalobacteraceae bacterium]